MTYAVKFQNRDFTDRVQPQGVVLDVEQMSWKAVGGCDRASVKVTLPGGSRNALPLWDLLKWIRRPVWIQGETARNIWWGFVYGVTVQIDAVSLGLTIDGMANKVAVAYSYVAPGTTDLGERRVTAYVQDESSEDMYGIMELRYSTGGMDSGGAVQASNTILGLRKYPQKTFSIQPGMVGVSATLDLAGWWYSLGWRYADVSAGAAVDNATQVGNMVTTYGEYITGVNILNTAGQTSSPYRDGETMVLDEVEALLETGTTNNRRLLAAINRARRLRVWEEPASTSVAYTMNSQGELRTAVGAKAQPGDGIAGCWCKMTDVIPLSAMSLHISDPSLFMIESVQWNRDGGLTPQPKGSADLWDVIKEINQ